MDEKEKQPSRFESEMTRLMNVVIDKLGEHDKRFDNLEKDVSEVKSDVRIIKGQFSDVAVMAIEDNKRITKLEKDVEDLQSNIH
jgi:peptidoglycan hydrolase CwlO-like protein